MKALPDRLCNYFIRVKILDDSRALHRRGNAMPCRGTVPLPDADCVIASSPYRADFYFFVREIAGSGRIRSRQWLLPHHPHRVVMK
jgi:hypothetical protein